MITPTEPIPEGVVGLKRGLSRTLCPTLVEVNGWADKPLLSWWIHFHTKRTNHIDIQMGTPTYPTWPWVVSTYVPIWKYLAHPAQRSYPMTFVFPVWKVSPRSRCHELHLLHIRKKPIFPGFGHSPHRYINHRYPFFQGMQKIPSFLIIEFSKISHSLT